MPRQQPETIRASIVRSNERASASLRSPTWSRRISNQIRSPTHYSLAAAYASTNEYPRPHRSWSNQARTSRRPLRPRSMAMPCLYFHPTLHPNAFEVARSARSASTEWAFANRMYRHHHHHGLSHHHLLLLLLPLLRPLLTYNDNTQLAGCPRAGGRQGTWGCAVVIAAYSRGTACATWFGDTQG